MSDEETRTATDSIEPDAPPGPEDSMDEGLRNLLKSAMKEDVAPPPATLEGFQRKLRARSGGKFYGEGWSTSKEPPTSLFLLTSLVMLAIVFAVWAALGPLSGSPAPVDNIPAPINVLSPPQTGQDGLVPQPSVTPAPPPSPSGE